MEGIYWEEKRKEILVAAGGTIAGISLLIAYLCAGPGAADFAKAEQAVAQWEKRPDDPALLQAMQKALAQAPDLLCKYEARIAQRLFDIGQGEEALSYAQGPLKRLEQSAPWYALFAETSLHIESGLMQVALEKAVSLKEALEREVGLRELESSEKFAPCAVLYGQNLVRIAFLQKELANRAGEKASWDEVEAFLAKEGPARDQVLAVFTDQKLDLKAYLSERQKLLK